MRTIPRSITMGALATLITTAALAQSHDSETLSITYEPIQLVSIQSGNHTLTFNSTTFASNVGEDTITLTANGSSTLSYTLSNGIQIAAAISFPTERPSIRAVSVSIGAGASTIARNGVDLWADGDYPASPAIIVPPKVGTGQAETDRTLTYKVTLDITAGGKFSSTLATVTYTASAP